MNNEANALILKFGLAILLVRLIYSLAKSRFKMFAYVLLAFQLLYLGFGAAMTVSVLIMRPDYPLQINVLIILADAFLMGLTLHYLRVGRRIAAAKTR